MADLGEQRVGIGHDRQLDMFGGEPVGERHRLGRPRTTMIVPWASQLARPWRGRHRIASRPRRRRPVGEFRVVGDQDGLRGGIVLGLAHQIGSDPLGIVEAVGDDEDLGRSGDHVDPDHAEQLALGLSDPGVAGAGDDIDRRDPFRAVGQRGDRLGPADPPQFVDPGEVRGGEDERIRVAIRSGRDHHDALDPRQPSRGSVRISSDEG